MYQSTSPLCFHSNTSPKLTKLVQLCLQTLCSKSNQNDHFEQHNKCNLCDFDLEGQLLNILEELTGCVNANKINFVSFVNNMVSSYSSHDKLYFIKSLSMILQHTNTKSSIHYFTIQLLIQIMKLSKCCSRLSDDISFIHFIIKHILENNNSKAYEILLQYISKNMQIHKIHEIKSLVQSFIKSIISDDQAEKYKLTKLIVLYNLITSNEGSYIKRYIKSLTNLKRFYKTLSRLMSNQNMWIVLYSLFILTKLVINDPIQSQLFHQNSINFVYQLTFNLIEYGVSNDTTMLKISIDLVSLMLQNDEMIMYLCNYPKLKQIIQSLLPFLLVFNSDNSKSRRCFFILKLLNIMIQSTTLQQIIIASLIKNNFLSVILKLCLHHKNLEYYSDYNISINALELITAITKSQFCNLSDNNNNNNNNNNEYFSLLSYVISSSHKKPNNIIINLNNSISVDNAPPNEQFIKELRKMNFIKDIIDVLFGHTEINGHKTAKKLCFGGHIDDYCLLSLSQKYIMYTIELLNVLSNESNEFKENVATLINIPDVAHYLYYSKTENIGQPNQIYLSMINFICSLSNEIDGISYLLKANLCDASIVSAITNSLNSKSNAKDIQNAIQFIYYIFNILSKNEEYECNNSYILNLVNDNDENKLTKRKYKRKTAKNKPRQYQNRGLTLSHHANNNDIIPSSQHDGGSVASSIPSLNVEIMSSKILYTLFCKRILRFNQTQKRNEFQLKEQHKKFEEMKSKHLKSIDSMKTLLNQKDVEIQQYKSHINQIENGLLNKTNDLKRLQQQFDKLNIEFMELEDNNQTNTLIVKDLNERMENMKNNYKEMKNQYDNKLEIYKNKNSELISESNVLETHLNEIMIKLNFVCEGYQKLKEESKINLKKMEENSKAKCNAINIKLEEELQKVVNLNNELQDSEKKKQELKNNLDAMIVRNSDLNHKCHQKDKQIKELDIKLLETNKLFKMIHNLTSKSANNNSKG